MNDFLDWDSLSYILIPLLICIARIIDVSIGTLRVILLTKGNRSLAPLLGFFEILIWLVAIGQIMQNLTSWVNYIAFALGFSLGNYIGIKIENWLALGTVAVRIITKKDASQLIESLKNLNYGITSVKAEGSTGPVHVLFTVIKRSAIPEISTLIKKFNPKSFYSIEDIRFAAEGILPAKSFWWQRKTQALKTIRKGK